MKNIAYFTLAILLGSIIYSCNDTELTEPVEQNTYYKLLGSYNNDFINSVEQSAGSGLLIAGYSQFESGISWAYLSKTLPSGMIEWDTSFSSDINSKAFDIFATNRNTFVAAMSEYYDADTTLLSLVELSDAGLFIDSVSVKVVANEIQNSQIIVLSDGSVRLLSQITREKPNVDNEYLSYIIIHDLTDDLNLTESFEIQLNQQIVGQVIIKYNTDSQVFVLANVLESANSDLTDIRIISMNQNSIAWDILHGEIGVSESASDFMVNNNVLVVAGNYKANAVPQVGYLVNYDLSGNIISEYQVAPGSITTDITCTSFALNDSNNYVFTGNVALATERGDILFLESTPTGEEVKVEVFGSNGTAAGNSVGRSIHFLQSENKYLLTGEMETFNNYDICVFKLNRQGKWISE